MTDYERDYTCPHGEPWGYCCQQPVAEERIADAWKPIDLQPYIDGTIVRPSPSIGIVRSDGLRMLYPGKEHACIGEMESGKSWYALGCAAAEMADNRSVVYIHFEESDPSDTVERLQLLGCPDWSILKLFKFVAPDRTVAAEWLAELLDPVPSLVVFDGVNEAMSLHGWDIRDESGAAEFRRQLVKPCTKVGAASLSLDHVVKDTERRGRTALGSVHKVNGLSGALIRLENVEPFGRDQHGCSHVFVMKDRPGYLRRNGEPTKATGHTFMGSMVVDDSHMYGPDLSLKFWAPNPKAKDDTAPTVTIATKVLAAVVMVIAKGLEPNIRNIRGAASMSKDAVDDALVRLVLDGLLTEHSGPRNARIFAVTVAEDHSSNEVV